MASPKDQSLLNAFLGSLKSERNFSPYTLINYRIDLLRFLAFIDERGTPLFSLDRLAARDFLYDLEKQKYSRRSLARKISAVRSFFRWLIREGKLKQNPFELISTPKLTKRLPNFLYLEEVNKLLGAIDKARDAALFELLYSSGIRVSEAVQLNLSDLDLAEGEVRVMGKGSKERISLMGRQAVKALTRYIKERKKGESKAVFLNRSGSRLTARSIERLIKF